MEESATRRIDPKVNARGTSRAVPAKLSAATPPAELRSCGGPSRYRDTGRGAFDETRDAICRGTQPTLTIVRISLRELERMAGSHDLEGVWSAKDNLFIFIKCESR